MAGTNDFLIDTLKSNLARVREINNTSASEKRKEKAYRLFGDRKYYNLAFVLLIAGVCNPVPEFVINLSDLTSELKKELANLDVITRDFVAKQAVGRIFEDIRFDLYHNSISRVLKVRFKK